MRRLQTSLVVVQKEQYFTTTSCSGMSLFNKVVDSKYNELILYAGFMIKVSRKQLQCEVVISNAFIKSQKHKPNTEDEAKAIILHYIKSECLYSRTDSQKEIITAIEFEVNDSHETKTIIDFHDIIDKEVNQWNFIDRVFFKTYMEFKRQNKNVKELAEFYSIDYTYARKKINELKKKIRCKI
jgi:hypothetical protein